jgi:hypothetical protein
LNRLAWQHALDADLPSVESTVQHLLDATWKNTNKRNSAKSKAITQRVRLVVVDALMDALHDDRLSPENALVLAGILRQFTKWLDRNDDTLADKALLEHLERYWDEGEWRGGFDAASMPPGLPI